jgi:CDP-diacylglycerol--glycerol-3-phosphate 3-phosphatidyltransferase
VTLANGLTLARLLAILPIMVALYVQFPGARTVVVVLYVAAILTDYFDGILARRQRKVTNFGKLMDSIADKALIVSLFFALVGEGLMPAWMAAVMVVREFAVTGLRMVALERGEVIAANRWGKAKMVSQSVAVLILLLGYAAVGLAAMSVALVLTLLSGWSYLKDAPRLLRSAGEPK